MTWSDSDKLNTQTLQCKSAILTITQTLHTTAYNTAVKHTNVNTKLLNL